MIAYDLQCADGHCFEGWFEDAQAYEDQNKKGMILCPVCNVASVARIPSTFAIKSSPSTIEISDQQAGINAIEQKIVEFVENNFDDVGCDFAKEALKIHYGAAEPRNIRGISTKEEEKTLSDEGVRFFKFPKPEPLDTDV